MRNGITYSENAYACLGYQYYAMRERVYVPIAHRLRTISRCNHINWTSRRNLEAQREASYFQ